MKFWVDAQLSPLLAAWLSEQFNVEALGVTCGDVTNRQLQIVFNKIFAESLELLATGQVMVEVK